MKTKLWAIALVFFFTFLTSAAQIMYKMAADRLTTNPTDLLANWPLLVGGILYIISAGLMMLSFRGGEISVLYPLISLSYVWVSILSPIFFPDSMNPWKWAGIAFIIGGVASIGVGSQK